MNHLIRVWDLPTRLFHWVLLALVIGLFVTGKLGGMALVWHFRFGYSVLVLLIFRVIWGLFGGHWSRFANFVPGPKTLLIYLKSRGSSHHHIGHNPMGALSVLALLAVLIFQAASGLATDDEIANAGPLVALVSGQLVSLATTFHKSIGQLALIILISLHVSAIFYYRLVKHQNLIKPMLLGDQLSPVELSSSTDNRWTRLTALGIVLLLSFVVSGLLNLTA